MISTEASPPHVSLLGGLLLLLRLWLGLGSDSKNNLGDLGHLIGGEPKGRAILLEMVIDFCSSFKSYCIDLLIAVGTLIGDIAASIFQNADVQVTLCRKPCPVTNESQSGVSDVTCKGGTSLDEFTVLRVEGVLSVHQKDRLAADLTIDASDGGLVVGSDVS